MKANPLLKASPDGRPRYRALQFSLARGRLPVPAQLDL